MSRSSLTLAIVLGLALAACDSGEPDSSQESGAAAGTSLGAGDIDRDRAGELMPAINLVHPDGRTLNLGAVQGRPVLLNLWATWCAPCVKEMPLLDEVSEDYDDNLRVVVASQDLQGAAKVVPFFEENDLPNLEPWMDSEAQLSFALSGVLPTTVLYDAGGQEVWRVVGDVDWADPQVRAAIDEVVGE